MVTVSTQNTPQTKQSWLRMAISLYNILLLPAHLSYMSRELLNWTVRLLRGVDICMLGAHPKVSPSRSLDGFSNCGASGDRVSVKERNGPRNSNKVVGVNYGYAFVSPLRFRTPSQVHTSSGI